MRWLLDAQEAGGSWFGRWGVNHLYGTGAAVPALAAWGLAQDDSVRRAVAWLESVQNADGGYGEDLRSYRDDAWRGRGASTASQTAWALLGLLSAGEASSPEVQQGIAYLMRTQQADGNWREDQFTGTGFPKVFYLKYHLYRLYFPLMALARYQQAVGDTALRGLRLRGTHGEHRAPEREENRIKNNGVSVESNGVSVH